MRKLVKFIDKLLFKSFFYNLIQKFRINLQKKKNRKFLIKKKLPYNYMVVDYNNFRNIFLDLCEKYGSDKGGSRKNLAFKHWPHNYSDYYDNIFFDKRSDFLKVFECGIGTNNKDMPFNMGSNANPGASLKVWRDYFFNAQIFGADIDKSVLFQADRIKTFYVDQRSEESIIQMWKSIGQDNFDLIIDDGYHQFDANICLFKNSINYLSKNGFYIIEDISEKDINNFYLYFQNKKFRFNFVNLFNEKYILQNNILVIRNIN